ncbi:MAG: glycyl-radical enzyme activating protein [Promethearchaeota archaeon]
MSDRVKGLVFNIQRFVLHDGPGIRTTVFLKGCPLRCVWCHNPEGLEAYPELIYRDSQCISSKKCILVCPENAITSIDTGINIDRRRCIACGDCAIECKSNALEICGEYMTTEDIMSEVLADIEFYKQSGGGLTVSGGEPLMQLEFLINLLKEAKMANLHTCLDTTGYCDSEKLEEVLKHVDTLLYDIKSLNEEMHEKLTGISNVLIIKNLKMCLDKAVDIIVRIPIIPGYNFLQVKEELTEHVKWLTEIGVKKFEVIPYHGFGEQKYKILGKKYDLKIKPIDKNFISNLAQELSKKYDILIKISTPIVT